MPNLPVLSEQTLLGETNAASINELMNRDPIKLTDAEVEQMRLYFRSKRTAFLAQPSAADKAEAKARAPAKAKLTLDQLKGQLL